MLKERDEGTRDFVLVDVREPNESEINQIPGAVLIPKGEFLNGHALEQLPSDKQIVMHCKTGVRSAETLAIVKGAGYADAVHVGGGVAAWVNQIDPSASRRTDAADARSSARSRRGGTDARAVRSLYRSRAPVTPQRVRS